MGCQQREIDKWRERVRTGAPGPRELGRAGRRPIGWLASAKAESRPFSSSPTLLGPAVHDKSAKLDKGPRNN